MITITKGKKEKVDELKEIEISEKFLEEYKKLVKKYHRDFDSIVRIVKVEKI